MIEHRVFQQVALSVQVPDDLHIIVTHNRDIFSNRDRQLDANKNMEVWFVQHDKWVVLEFPVIGDEVTPEEAHFKLVTYMRHLKYPLIVSKDLLIVIILIINFSLVTQEMILWTHTKEPNWITC